MSGRMLALSTVARAADAERIARALVERRLAACVNVVPGVVSFYRWKGALERDAERLLLIKTRAERLEALRRALVEMHPYEVPELVAVSVAGGHPAYLEWLDASVGASDRASGAARPARRVRPAPAPGRPRGLRRPRSRR